MAEPSGVPERGIKSTFLNLFERHKAQNGQVLQLPSENPDNIQRQEFYKNRMDRMRNVLEKLCLTHLVSMFMYHDISIENIPSLSDADFEKLGVKKIGDKNRLKTMCTDIQNGIEDSKDFYTEDTVMDVQMDENSSFQMGDRGNHVTQENIINAESIERLGQDGEYSRIASSSSTKISMGVNSKFDSGNKDNIIQNSTQIDATHIKNVGGIAGLPGLSGIGGSAGNVNINMGHGASLQGLGMIGYDTIKSWFIDFDETWYSNYKYHENGKREKRSRSRKIYKSTKVPGYLIYEGHAQ